MVSESNGLAWVENLHHRFNTFCSQADDIIYQEPLKYAQSQLLTAGESLKQFCSELVEDVLPNFMVGAVGENGPTSPKQEENTGLPVHKISNISTDEDQEGKSDPVNAVSSLLSIEPVCKRCANFPSNKKATLPGLDEVRKRFIGQNVGNDECNVLANLSTSVRTPVVNSSEKTEQSSNNADAKFSPEFQAYEPPDDDITTSTSSWSTEAIHSNDSIMSGGEPSNELFKLEFAETLCNPDSISAGETADCYVTELGIEAPQPSVCQKIDESIVLVNRDEFCIDNDMEAKYLSYKVPSALSYLCVHKAKVKFCPLNKKLAKKPSCETITQGINAEIDQVTVECLKELSHVEEELKTVDEDMLDCDWEIV